MSFNMWLEQVPMSHRGAVVDVADTLDAALRAYVEMRGNHDRVGGHCRKQCATECFEEPHFGRVLAIARMMLERLPDSSG